MTAIPVVNFPAVPLAEGRSYARAADIIGQITGVTGQAFQGVTTNLQREVEMALLQSRQRQTELAVRGAEMGVEAQEHRLELAKLQLGSERLARVYEDIYELQEFDLWGRLAQASAEEIADLTTSYPFLNTKLRDSFAGVAESALGHQIIDDIYRQASEHAERYTAEGKIPPEFNYRRAMDQQIAKLDGAGLSPDVRAGILNTFLPQLRNKMLAEKDRKLAYEQQVKRAEVTENLNDSVDDWLMSPDPAFKQVSDAMTQYEHAVLTQGIDTRATDQFLENVIESKLLNAARGMRDPAKLLERVYDVEDPESRERLQRKARAAIAIVQQEREQARVEKEVARLLEASRASDSPEQSDRLIAEAIMLLMQPRRGAQE